MDRCAAALQIGTARDVHIKERAARKPAGRANFSIAGRRRRAGCEVASCRRKPTVGRDRRFLVLHCLIPTKSGAPRRRPLTGRPSMRSAGLPLASEAHLLGKLRACLSIVRCNHRVTRVEAPFLTVLIGSEPVVGHQVALQRLELLSVLEADDIVVMDGFLRVDCRLLLVSRRLFRAPPTRPSAA